MGAGGDEAMPNQGNEQLTMSVEECAKILSISRGLCYEMVRQKKIPALHFNRVIRIPRHALLEQLLSVQDTDDKAKEV